MEIFFTSLRDALIRPKVFYPSLIPEGPWGPPLLFAIGLAIISSVGFAATDFLFPQPPLFGMAPWPWYWNLIDWPLLLLFEFLFLAWFHLILRWRKGTTFPFKATFRGYCYSSAPNIFCLIPWVGAWIALLWGLVLSFYGVKTLQRTTWTRVITSFLIANALLGLFIFAIIFAAGYFRQYFES